MSRDSLERLAERFSQLALVIRGLGKGAVPPVPFILVSMVATGLLSIGWRTAFAKLTPQVPMPSTQQDLHPPLPPLLCGGGAA